MDHRVDTRSASPDGRHSAHFAAAGEVRFGPLYFALAVDGRSFGERIFGEAHLWSPDLAWLVVQEWLTLDYSAGPITALVLIDLRQGREAAVARATKAFLVPQEYSGSLLAYRAERAGNAGGERFEVDIDAVAEWRAIG